MIILASASPRRKELMALITANFTVDAYPTDERFEPGAPPPRAVEQIALRKAEAAARIHPEDIVIGADTVVELDGTLLGKPADQADAVRMLEMLSGRGHLVHTGVAVVAPQGVRVFSQSTAVRFIALTREQIERYVASGEPMDKAGAYGIQGLGALLVDGIEGDFYNVMGLPVCRLAQELRRLGVGLDRN